MNKEDKKTAILSDKKIKYYVKISQTTAILTLPVILLIFRNSLRYVLILSAIPFAIGIFFLFTTGLQYMLYKSRQKKKIDNMVSRKGGM